VADDGRAKASRVTGRDHAGEKYAGVSATPGARNLERRRRAKRGARPHECSGILPPFRFIEVDCDKVAAVIFQQGVRSMASTPLNEQEWNRDAIERQLAHHEFRTRWRLRRRVSFAIPVLHQDCVRFSSIQ
jgi:hypothetical protein